MGSVLLCRVESAQPGYSLRSGLAVNGQAFCSLEGFDGIASRAEVVPVLHVKAAEAVSREELLQFADIIADAPPLEHAGEDVPALAFRDLRFRPERRTAEAVPAVAGERHPDHAVVAAFCFDYVQIGIDDVPDMRGLAVLVELEHEIADAESVLGDLRALVIEPVSGEIICEVALHVLQPVHAEA